MIVLSNPLQDLFGGDLTARVAVSDVRKMGEGLPSPTKQTA